MSLQLFWQMSLLGALDSKTGRLVMDLFHKLNKEKHKTIVLITHSNELAQETDRIISIKDGNIVDIKPGNGKHLENEDLEDNIEAEEIEETVENEAEEIVEKEDTSKIEKTIECNSKYERILDEIFNEEKDDIKDNNKEEKIEDISNENYNSENNNSENGEEK